MKKRKRPSILEGKAPHYRPVPRQMLSDVVAGRVQAGPHSTPPREDAELDHWQDEEWFHSPEL